MPSTALSKYATDVGAVFGRLTTVEKLDPTNSGETRWRCLCSCGAEKVMIARSLRKSHAASCGCYRDEVVGNANRRHGRTGTREYAAWVSLIGRCTNPKHKAWGNYGGRGLSVSPEWRADFMTFFNDMGPRPTTKHSIERLDNNSGYSKENCKWATKVEQSNNQRTNRLITVGDQSLTAPQWARLTGITASAIRSRLQLGWSPRDAVSHIERPREYGGVSLGTLAEYSGIHYSVIHVRIHQLGWSLEKTLTTPVKAKKLRNKTLRNQKPKD